MRKLTNLFLLLFFIPASSLFALDVDVPNEVLSYRNLEITLSLSPSDGVVEEARFYFQQTGKREPVYTEFSESKGIWSALVPYTYLEGEELIYYTLMKNTNGVYIRDPQIGNKKARLIKDETAPTLKLVSPQAFELALDKEQLVVFEILDESALTNFEIFLNDEPLEKAGVFQQYLSFLAEPKETKDVEISISMTDSYGNSKKETFVFSITGVKAPMFLATADYFGDFTAEYVLSMGETTNTTVIQDVLSDLTHEVTLDFQIGGETYLKAGPLALEFYASLEDSVAASDILEAYPNTLTSDFQNFMNLYHPWNFADEFDYTGEEARKFDNSNQFYARLSFFGDALSYTLGDQKISFQNETVKDLYFRGTSVVLDIPFLDLAVGKGLTDLGLYQTAWPQNFFGLKFGLKAKKAFYLQTNLSFISSLQGRYENLSVSGATSQIETLYDLGSITPEENMVLGLSTGTQNKYFSLNASVGLSLYVSDASSIIDKNKLATDIEEGFDFDISPYLEYVDTISEYFPILDYFPFSLGLAVDAVNRDLWGLTYGAEFSIPTLGLEAWLRKTDSTFKSLGASVVTDQLSIGGTLSKDIADFSLSAGYEWNKDTIPDILFNDILPLFDASLAPSADPTENDISNIVHTATLGVGTPSSTLLGSLTFDYTFELKTTNAQALSEELTDGSALINSTKNDTTNAHTGDLRWRSGRYKIKDLTVSLGAKTKESYVTNVKVDGVLDGTSYWEYSYGVSTSLKFKRYSLSLGFDNEWSTETNSITSYGYDGKLSIANTFFDSISISGSFDQAFKASALQAYRIAGLFGLDKRFGPLSTSISFEAGYFDSMTDDAEDALTSKLTVKGTVSR